MNAPPEHDEPTDPRSWILLVGAASLCELVASSLACGAISCSGLNAYAVSVGAVSTAFVTPIAIVYFAEPLAPPRLSEAIPHLSLLLLVWWIPAIFLLTFVAPFSGLSNGWFATVGAAAGAFNLCRAHVPALEGVVQQAVTASAHAPPERTVLLGLGVSSTAVWVGAAISATLYGDGPATHVWAIIVGVISSVLCAFYLLLDNLAIHRLGFAALLSVWWLQGAALSFVPTSFIGSMNGFLSTWASVFLAAYFLRITRSPHDLLPVPSAEPPDETGDAGLRGPTTIYQAAVDVGVDMPAGRLGPDPTDAFRHTGAPEL